MRDRNSILVAYDGDMKNIVIPAGTRMIRGEEIAFGTEFEEEDQRLWHRRVKAPFSRNKTIETVFLPCAGFQFALYIHFHALAKMLLRPFR